MENFKNSPFVKKVGFNRIVLVGVMILMYIIFSIASGRILGYANIMSALNYAYFLGFLALGVTFVIATGGIDFSIGPVMFCAALIGGRLLVKDGVPVIVALLVCILVGMLFTCVLQSASAAVGILQALAATGVITCRSYCSTGAFTSFPLP